MNSHRELLLPLGAVYIVRTQGGWVGGSPGGVPFRTGWVDGSRHCVCTKRKPEVFRFLNFAASYNSSTISNCGFEHYS